MATKKQVNEDKLTEANIARVITLLEPTGEGVKPITKKDACSILGITYNTTRLGTLIEKHKEKLQREEKRRQELRGTPATLDEMRYMISEYLDGVSISEISRTTYRSPNFIQKVLENNAVPIKAFSFDYFKPELIPSGSARERFEVGEIVYSARYESKARVEAEYVDKKNLGYIYRIWLLAEKWQQYAYTEAFELSSLSHLKENGVKL